MPGKFVVSLTVRKMTPIRRPSLSLSPTPRSDKQAVVFLSTGGASPSQKFDADDIHEDGFAAFNFGRAR